MNPNQLVATPLLAEVKELREENLELKVCPMQT